ncbi:MAG: hypothetical protein IKC32_04775 [Clostridia bacterium]|nr:hypothetical protein [Clostridia bacterium]
MIEKDTVRLLRECDSGIRMGISSIDDVLPYATSDRLKETLSSSKSEHARLADECDRMLRGYGDEGKAPSLMATGMSKMKCAMKLGLHPSDRSIADLITDGCSMGIKSLSGYLNEYEAAEERAKDIAKKLISMEDELGRKMRDYL